MISIRNSLNIEISAFAGSRTLTKKESLPSRGEMIFFHEGYSNLPDNNYGGTCCVYTTLKFSAWIREGITCG